MSLLKERVLTREQRRYKERIEKEAQQTLKKLADKFYDVFMEEDPDSPEIERKRKEFSAKWKMYCAKSVLVKEAYVLFDNAAKAILDKYKEQLNTENIGYGREAEIAKR